MKIYFDGGAAPNPGKCHAAINIDGNETIFDNELGYGTNNIAEWTALVWALSVALDRGATEVEIIGDSMLVVMQANGKWKINKAEFHPFKKEFDRLKTQFKKCVVRHIGREKNLAGMHIEQALKKR